MTTTALLPERLYLSTFSNYTFQMFAKGNQLHLFWAWVFINNAATHNCLINLWPQKMSNKNNNTIDKQIKMQMSTCMHWYWQGINNSDMIHDISAGSKNCGKSIFQFSARKAAYGTCRQHTDLLFSQKCISAKPRCDKIGSRVMEKHT